MSKGGSKLFVSIIAFLLGFIFAILAEVGAIFGVYFYVTSQDIDSILAAVGLPNRDENGNNRYINTDPENGGAKTLKDLIASLQGMFYENGELSILNKSFNDIEELIPATNMLLSLVYSTLGDYVDLNREKFESAKFTEIAQVLSDSVMNVHIGTLLEKMNSDMAENENILVKSLLLGAETEYATVIYDGSAETRTVSSETAELKFPVLYDIYRDDGMGWSREQDSSNGKNGFHANLKEGDRDEEYYIDVSTVTEKADGEELTNRTGKLCYVPCKVTEYGIQPAGYKMSEYEYDKNGEKYVFQYVDYEAGTDFIAVKANSEGRYVLDYSRIWDSLNPSYAGGSDTSTRFLGYSYFDEYGRDYFYIEDKEGQDRPDLKTISGKNYFRDSANKAVQLDPLTLYDLIYNTYDPLYSVAVTEVVGKNAEVAHDLFGKTTLGDLLDGNVKFENLVNGMELSSLVNNVKPDNKLMAYIVFKLSDVKEVRTADGEVIGYTAIYNKFEKDCEEVNVILDENGNINTVKSKRTGAILAGVKVDEVAAIADKMTVNLLTDISANDSIMSYIGYGIYGIKEEAGENGYGAYQYTAKIKVNDEEKNCFLSTQITGGKPVIETVWYLDEDDVAVPVKGTRIADVSDKVGSLTEDLTIGEVIKITEDSSQLLKSIKNTKIEKLGDKIENLKIRELFTPEQIEGNSILKLLGNVGISDIPDAINETLIQRIYAKDIYGAEDPHLVQSAAEINGTDLYYIYDSENETYKLANGDGHVDSFEEGTYYTYGKASAMWELILYRDGKEHAYSIKDFGDMVSACTKNIYGATINKLIEAGVISDIEPTDSRLNKQINGIPIGDCTLQQIINFALDAALAS